MDKQATRILLACILCTVIVFLLFLIAIRFNQLSCELVRIEPVHLRTAQLQAFNKSKPIRSHDKTMLMKISAYLEYNLPAVGGSSSSSSSSGQSGAQWSNTSSSGGALAGANNPGQQQLQSIQSSNGSSSGRLVGPSPSIPQLNVLQSTAGVGSGTGPAAGSGAAQATGGAGPAAGTTTNVFQNQPGPGALQTNGSLAGLANNQLASSWSAGQSRDEKRFLPLDLDEIQTRKLDDGKFKYSLTFNCSTLNMIVIRQAQRVYIESMSLELEPTSQKKSTCDILLPAPMAINTAGQLGTNTVHQQDTIQVAGQDDGLAHYHCRAAMVYNCFYFPSQKPPVVATDSLLNAGAGNPAPVVPRFGNNQLNGLSLQHGGQLVAVLHINAIEFETILLNSSQHLRHESFRSKARDCEQNPSQTSAQM